ncbi:MAG: DUF4091 domain-containing protein [Kiritimatiellaeota bacterium]|nr:DUF4091 domain-containing protein [Kiritimatiellota bacterium]
MEKLASRVILICWVSLFSGSWLRSAEANNIQVDYRVGVASNLKKIFRDKPFPGNVGNTADITAARNEYEGFQLIVLSSKKTLKNIRLEISDLVNRKTNSRIGVRNIKYNVVGYVKTDKGVWPDPLFDEKTFTIEAGKIQPVWVTVYVPETAPPGDYEGFINVKPANSHSTKIKVSVKVRNFTLPREFHLKTDFWLHWRYIKLFAHLDKVTFEEYKKYCDILTSHRISYADNGSSALVKAFIEPDGSISFDFSVADQYLEYYMSKNPNALNVSFYECGGAFFRYFANLPVRERTTGKSRILRYKRFSPEHRKIVIQYLRDYTNHLKEKGWYDNKAYIKVFDEPNKRKGQYAYVKKTYGLIKDAVPDLKRLIAINSIAAPELIGYIDIWCPKIQRYNSLFYALRKRAGDEIWWYVCGWQKNYPDFDIGLPAISHRILFWLSWKYNISGVLYYGVNYWSRKNYTNYENGPYPYKKTPSSYPYDGGGYLLYPGRKGPLSSVRLEVIRDGLEDYEYFFLLKEKIAELEREKPKGYQKLLKESKSVMNIPNQLVDLPGLVPGLIPNPAQTLPYPDDPEKLYNAREKIATQIEKINGFLNKKL